MILGASRFEIVVREGRDKGKYKIICAQLVCFLPKGVKGVSGFLRRMWDSKEERDAQCCV